MITNRNISVIGGDTRLIFAAEYLAENNNNVQIYGCDHYNISKEVKKVNALSEALNCEIIILPLPVSKNGKTLNSPLSSEEISINEIINKINEKHYVFLGMGQPNLIKQICAKTSHMCDYFNIEAFTYLNARLTAEGVLSLILDKLPISLYQLNIAICGYGRIAELLTHILIPAGARVTIFARSDEQRIKAELSGAKSYSLNCLTEKITEFDCLINTVPHQIIHEKIIKNSKRDCLFIETASHPYGINFEECINNDRKLIKAFSLPGKIAPKTAGIIIADTISYYMQEV